MINVFFSPTTGVVAGRLNRLWVMADARAAAIETCRRRLERVELPFTGEKVQLTAGAKED
jgi:hypothetical protein